MERYESPLHIASAQITELMQMLCGIFALWDNRNAVFELGNAEGVVSINKDSIAMEMEGCQR